MPQFSDVSDMQLQLRGLELQHARKERQQQLELKKLELERERQKKERQQQLELKKLKLEMSRVSDPSAHPTDPPSSSFPVEAEVKLVPKFSENDVETFLISFENVAELNNFPPDKYVATLQAHLTRKALKVFSELSVEKARDDPTLKMFCFRRTRLFPRSIENATGTSVRFTLRLILSLLSV